MTDTCPTCETIPVARAVVRDFKGGVLRKRNEPIPISGKVLACPNCGHIHSAFDTNRVENDHEGPDYYGIFPDAHAIALEGDENVQVLSMEDSEKTGSRRVQFRIQKDD